MTIIVAFILEAFVFRMNYSRKSQDSEGLYGCHALSTGCPAGHLPHPTVPTVRPPGLQSPPRQLSFCVCLVCLGLICIRG